MVGQLRAAADRCPLFFEEFSASRQREATRGYSRLSAVCQPEIHLAYGIQIRSDVISPFAPGIWRP
jgi:hypothetical protein